MGSFGQATTSRLRGPIGRPLRQLSPARCVSGPDYVVDIIVPEVPASVGEGGDSSSLLKREKVRACKPEQDYYCVLGSSGRLTQSA